MFNFVFGLDYILEFAAKVLQLVEMKSLNLAFKLYERIIYLCLLFITQETMFIPTRKSSVNRVAVIILIF